MKNITVQVPENKYSFFIELLKSLGFVKFQEKNDVESDEEVLNNIAKGLKEAKQIEEGKLKSKSAKDFLREL